MKCILMHKDLPVAKLDLDEVLCGIRKVDEVYNAEHLPVGIHIKRGHVDRAELNEWWIDRSIPASRSGVKKALEALNISNTRMLVTKCFGLSLSDQYWIKPTEREDLSWDDINFFEHPFSEDIGDVLLGKAVKKDAFDFHSPDNTSDGCLKKRWKIIDGKRCLVKAGSAPLMLQPFNEVVATVVMKKLNVPHVPYWLIWDDEIPYSVCEDFVTPDTELVSAWRVMHTTKKDNNTSVYRHYINCCEKLGIENIVLAVDQMIVVDYIIANEDRHLNNFGLIRNATTLEWVGVAPVFDSGSSLGYNKMPAQVLSGKGVECKPFKKKHEEQILLVNSFDWIDFEALKDIEEDIRKVFSQAGMYVEETRIDAIVKSVKQRIANLEKLAQQKTEIVDNIAEDVERNIAETYG